MKTLKKGRQPRKRDRDSEARAKENEDARARYKRLTGMGICYICAKNPIRRNKRCADCYVAYAQSMMVMFTNNMKEILAGNR